jgi:hypothetical protein
MTAGKSVLKQFSSHVQTPVGKSRLDNPFASRAPHLTDGRRDEQSIGLV